MSVKTHNGGPLAIDLALQGGGAHGAFTWGVLDRLLEEAQLRIDAISGQGPYFVDLSCDAAPASQVLKR